MATQKVDGGARERALLTPTGCSGSLPHDEAPKQLGVAGLASRLVTRSYLAYYVRSLTWGTPDIRDPSNISQLVSPWQGRLLEREGLGASTSSSEK